MDNIENSSINYQKMKGVYDTAFEESRLIGKSEGKIEGRIEGRIEGKLAAIREIAIRMKNMGFPIDFISEATSVSKNEIEKL